MNSAIDGQASRDAAPTLRTTVTTLAVVGLFATALMVVIGLWASPVLAQRNGIFNKSGNPETGGVNCSQCHGFSSDDMQVRMNVLDTAEAGTTVPMSITILGGVADGAGIVAGFNASISRGIGTLATQDPDTRTGLDEITHTTPKSMIDGEATFQFQWTAPTVGTVVRMYAAGVSANASNTNAGDFTAFSRKIITVTGGTPEIQTSVDCIDIDGEETGHFTVALQNPFDTPSSYTINIDGTETNLTLFGDEQITEVIPGFADGTTDVTVLRDDALEALTVFDDSYEVACADEPPVTIPGAEGPIEVAHAVSCLADNGRIDTNIINTGAGAADYRIEFQGLSARQFNVAAGDWWRMPITGRAEGDYQIIVKRNTVVVSDQTITVSCDSEVPVIGAREIQVVNACRADRGYVLFQFLNASETAKPYIIEFEGVPNRSTTADVQGQSLRAVTGRQNGTYEVLIRTGQTPVATFPVTVNCVPPVD